MSNVDDLYKYWAHISSLQNNYLPPRLVGSSPGQALANSRFQHTLSSWAVAGRPDNDPAAYEYYLIEADSILYTGREGSLKLLEYAYNFNIVDESNQILPDVVLLAYTPDTIVGATSYSTSMNESVSASAGFFGTDPTATVGDTVSFGHSVTRQIPDIKIRSECLRENGQNAGWNFDIAPQAPAQGGTLQFTVQMLYRRAIDPAKGNKPVFVRMNFRLGTGTADFSDDHSQEELGAHWLPFQGHDDPGDNGQAFTTVALSQPMLP